MSTITENKVVNREINIGYECDICCTKILGSLPKTWHSFDHGHCDWGNDSHESREQFHVCSIGCYAEQLKISLDKMKNNRNSAEISGMGYDFAQQLYTIIK